MPLNLLKHKSYHVYKSKNVDRVKRDEAEAKKKTDEIEASQKSLERKNRMAQLRERRGLDTTETQGISGLEHQKASQIASLEEGGNNGTGNKTPMQKDEGGSATFSQVNKKPWYIDSDSKEKLKPDAGKKKYPLDPLTQINDYIKKTDYFYKTQGGNNRRKKRKTNAQREG